MERETGFEPATPTLARSCSTTELFPPASGTVTQLRNPNHLAMSIRSLLSATLGPFRPLPGHTGGTRRPQCARFLTHGSQPGTRSPRAERTAIPRSKAPPTTSPRCRHSTPLRREGRSSGPLSLLRSSVIFGACRTSFYVADGDAFLKPDFEGSAGADDRLSEGHLTSARPGPVDGKLDFWRRSTETV